MNNYRKATHYVCDQVEEKIVDGELKFPDYTFAQAVADGVPGIDWKTDGQFGSYYQVAELQRLWSRQADASFGLRVQEAPVSASTG
jgi:hypothetical protein